MNYTIIRGNVQPIPSTTFIFFNMACPTSASATYTARLLHKTPMGWLKLKLCSIIPGKWVAYLARLPHNTLCGARTE